MSATAITKRECAGSKVIAASQAQDWRGAVAAVETLRADGIVPSTILCNKLISCLCKHGQLELADAMFMRMCGAAADEVRAHARTCRCTLSNACQCALDCRPLQLTTEAVTARTHRQCQGYDGVGHVREPDLQGVGLGVAASAVTYATLIKAFGAAGAAPRALVALRALQASATPVDTVTWNAAISACAASGHAADAAAAVGLLQEAERAHAADVVTYNAALAALQAAGDAAQARALLARLAAQRGSVQPNEVRSCSVIDFQCCHIGTACSHNHLVALPAP
jgi:pentatricopeptide repeat protein